MTTLDRLAAALTGRYEVSKEIGAGGMATVFLGHDIKHDRDVAIKVLHPDLGAALGSERFLSEIKTTAKLQHPHILPLLDSGEADSLLYYVMPFVVGESLRARIDRERQLPISEAVRITKEVAGALDYAHRHGVIHRDIKPENILLHDGQALVADFGIALAVSAAGGGRLTQTGLSLGTPQYMSPEQAVGERTIDARSDIYSLGAVTYEMITGDPPFTGNNIQAIVSKIMTQRPTPITTLRDTVPETVDNAVMIALSKVPADRFATAAEFATALTTHVSGFSHTAQIHRAGAGRRGADFFRQRGVIALIALSAILLATTLWSFLKPQPLTPVRRYTIDFDSSEAFTGSLSRLALSPDGSTIAYTSVGNKLAVRRRDQLHATILTTADQAFSPFFSPDGQRVGYVGPPSVLKVVSLNGGPSIKISDSIAAGGAAFGPDGYIYATGIAGRTIVRFLESPDAPVKRVTKLDSAGAEGEHAWPDPLPNGRGVLFTIRYSGGANVAKTPAIAVVDLRTGKHRVLVTGVRARYSPSGHILYTTSDGTLMAAGFDQSSMKLTSDPVAVTQGLRLGTLGASDFHVSGDGTLLYLLGSGAVDRELLWVSRDGKANPVDPSWRAGFTDPRISPDGSRAAVSLEGSANGNSDVWIKQLDHGPALKLTFDALVNVYPVWTVDGKSVTYESATLNKQVFMTKRADGSAQSVLQYKYARDLAEALWSGDGKWLIARTSSNVAGGGDILAIRNGTDSNVVAIAATPFGERTPALSPDGRWLAYTSNESGRNEIFVVPFPAAGTAKWPVSTKGGTEPGWSHSGREIFYRDAAGNLISVPVRTAPTFSAGAPTTLFSLRDYVSNPNHRQWDVSPDDKRFLVVRNASGSASDKLVVVDNWFEELRGKSRK